MLVISVPTNLTNTTGILAHHTILQRRGPLRQSLHPDAVLPGVPYTAHARGLLDNDLNPGYLRHMGSDERILELYPSCEILGSLYPRLLFEQDGTVVLEC